MISNTVVALLDKVCSVASCIVQGLFRCLNPVYSVDRVFTVSARTSACMPRKRERQGERARDREREGERARARAREKAKTVFSAAILPAFLLISAALIASLAPRTDCPKACQGIERVRVTDCVCVYVCVCVCVSVLCACRVRVVCAWRICE